MKKLLAALCVALMFSTTPVMAKPAPKCKTVQKCKTHKMLQGHKVPVKKKQS
jgi:hypothetical protein